jgi:hypothetical protein
VSTCAHCQRPRTGDLQATLILAGGTVRRTWDLCDSCAEQITRDLSIAESLIRQTVAALN